MEQAARYTQVKVSVAPDLAAAFKSKCLDEGVSMASEIAGFMRDRLADPMPKKTFADPFATRRQRRKAVKLLANQLTEIMMTEQIYKDNIPENLQGSRFYDAAELTVAALEEALNALAEAY